MKKAHYIWKDEKLEGDEVFSGVTQKIIVNDDFSSYKEQHLEIYVGADGHLVIHDEHVENHVFFYPGQLKHLQKALTVAVKQARKHKEAA